VIQIDWDFFPEQGVPLGGHQPSLSTCFSAKLEKIWFRSWVKLA